jgi:16S rRNA (guanine966-N2)-methyltransferase
VRITGGKARGIPLRTGKQSVARPATDRLREAVFSSLGERVIGARFFDLFVGSGAYGLEAWSRGAAGGLLVERNRTLVGAIRQNLEAVARSVGEGSGAVEVIAADVTRWTTGPGDRADLIFVDPPYELIPRLAPALFDKFNEWLAPEGMVIFEMPGGIELAPEGWECVKRIGKGRHQPGCCFYQTV